VDSDAYSRRATRRCDSIGDEAGEAAAEVVEAPMSLLPLHSQRTPDGVGGVACVDRRVAAVVGAIVCVALCVGCRCRQLNRVEPS
jgi:hypothetical protein